MSLDITIILRAPFDASDARILNALAVAIPGSGARLVPELKEELKEAKAEPVQAAKVAPAKVAPAKVAPEPAEVAEEAVEEPETAPEPVADTDASDAPAATREEAVRRATELVSKGKSAAVRSALNSVREGARVSELEGPEIAAFLKALEA